MTLNELLDLFEHEAEKLSAFASKPPTKDGSTSPDLMATIDFANHLCDIEPEFRKDADEACRRFSEGKEWPTDNAPLCALLADRLRIAVRLLGFLKGQGQLGQSLSQEIDQRSSVLLFLVDWWNEDGLRIVKSMRNEFPGRLSDNYYRSHNEDDA